MMNERKGRPFAGFFGTNGFPVLFLIAGSAAAFAYLLKRHAFGESIDENGTIYTRMLLLAVVMVVWIAIKGLLRLTSR
jgi:hypothetical protein